ATVAGPGGVTFERDIVHHPGAVVVVPVVGGGREGEGPGAGGGTAVLLVRQYRAAVGAELLELPAGKRDVDGEAPEDTARRELEEEVGMRAGRLRELAQFYNSPGFCDEHSHLYLASDLTPSRTSPQGVEEANMAVERVTLSQVAALVASGAIVDAKTIVGLCLARQALEAG
ncbi:MAG: NUDIX hydrolase, partial [Acidimicrobiales bacterium]